MREFINFCIFAFTSTSLTFQMGLLFALVAWYAALLYFTKIKPARLANFQRELFETGAPGSTCPRCGFQEIISEEIRNGKIFSRTITGHFDYWFDKKMVSGYRLSCLNCKLEAEVTADGMSLFYDQKYYNQRFNNA